MPAITKEMIDEFENDIREAATVYKGDEEGVHIAMDEIMCKLLRNLGFGAGVDIFESTDKWYS